MSNLKTRHIQNFVELDVATTLYEKMKSGISWEDGIYSSRAGKITRKAHGVSGNSDIDNEIQLTVVSVMSRMELTNDVEGIYVNYYRDGNDWAPTHNHPGQVQLIISLGATRKLRVGTKTYDMANGDVIMFGSSAHEILLDPTVTEGRISIAVFMKK